MTPSRATSAVLVCLLAGPAIAEPEPEPEPEPPRDAPRPLRWNLHAGGLVAPTGPAGYGPMAAIELSPGGRFDRFGATVQWRGFEGVDAGWVAGGWVYEAAAARPLLVLSLHGEAGATYGGDHTYPVVGGGVTSRLWLAGPFFIGSDGGAHLLYDGVDSRLVFGFSVVVGLGR
jgi:hypothetical protein